MPASSHLSCISSGHKLDCTSPICAFCSISIQSLDCPIPPPIVSGSSPDKICLWYALTSLSVAFASSNCFLRLSASTLMPIDEISILSPSTSS